MTASGASDLAHASTRIERTVDVQGIETHLFEAGNPAAPPVVYLHGTFLGNLWLDHHTALARQFHLVAPDIPGFGLTPRPGWMRDMSDYTLYFRDLLDALALEKPALVGHSLGGWMAAELAVWFPERIDKLVLANAAGIHVKGSSIADLFAMNPRELLAASFDNLAAAMPLIPPVVDTDYLIDQYRQRMTLATLAWNPHYDPRLERRLERVMCPTLIVWGENDRIIPPIYGERFHQLIPGSAFVTLKDTGHMAMFELPEAWSRVVADFLAGSASQGDEQAPSTAE